MTSPDAGNATPLWTEGICGDGAAILRDGVMVPIEEVVRALNRGEAPRERRIEIAAKAMWDGMKHDPRFRIGPWEERGQDDAARFAWICHATDAVDALFPEDAPADDSGRVAAYAISERLDAASLETHLKSRGRPRDPR